ncbi:hypothetical protein MLD52_18420 [Puniceicoccaceae bacterium K14]|nr:hypothetical protein [Puniceicoccaceae bacterium K14]
MKKLFLSALFTMVPVLSDAGDPSLIPAIGLDGVESSERFRFIADFDLDGYEDLLLSLPTYTFGTSGSYFTLYLREGNDFVEAGEINAHPKSVSIENLGKKTRIWVYLHGSSSSGTLGYYILENGILSELHSIEINPGDGGTKIGNSIVRSVFLDRLMVEKSTTINGVVNWDKWN